MKAGQLTGSEGDQEVNLSFLSVGLSIALEILFSQNMDSDPYVWLNVVFSVRRLMSKLMSRKVYLFVFDRLSFKRLSPLQTDGEITIPHQ